MALQCEENDFSKSAAAHPTGERLRLLGVLGLLLALLILSHHIATYTWNETRCQHFNRCILNDPMRRAIGSYVALLPREIFFC